MKVYRYKLDNGDCYGFSISNTLCSRIGVMLAVKNIPGSQITRKPKKLLSWFREDIFCEFTINQKNFYVEDPYGDSSDFDIFCDIKNTKEMEIVIQAFENKKFDFIAISFWVTLASLLITQLAKVASNLY
jgi:hypothetical protein